MSIWLKFKISYDESNDLVDIELNEYRQGKYDRWPQVRMVGSETMKINPSSIFYTASYIPVKVNKIQKKMRDKYKKNIKLSEAIKILCTEYSKGKWSISDSGTNNLVKKYKKD